MNHEESEEGDFRAENCQCIGLQEKACSRNHKAGSVAGEKD